MGLLAVTAEVVTVVATLVAVATVAVVGTGRMRRTVLGARDRFRAARWPLLGLAFVLVLNSVLRDVGVEFSWIIGLDVTRFIYGVEGEFVAWLQSLGTPSVTMVLGYVYVYGYVFLLVFPLVAYFALERKNYLRATATAYVVNYAVGLLCYLLFIAYGPRNYMPDVVQSLLYDALPRFQILTSAVNTNTNVFPSLHTSLSVTVALLAICTRDIYPRWMPVAVTLATLVAISTMYLGIHWMTDVVAGLVLGVGSVAVAAYLYDI